MTHKPLTPEDRATIRRAAIASLVRWIRRKQQEPKP